MAQTDGLVSAKLPKPLSVILVVLALAVFAAHYHVEKTFHRLGVFDQFNVLFDSDPNKGLALFSEGRGRVNLIHPAAHLICLPVSATARVAGGLTSMETADLRVALALLGPPLSAALATIAAGLMFWWSGFRSYEVVVLVAFGRVAFSNVIFGSIPDHFGLTAFPLTALMALTARAVVRGERGLLATWIVFGFLATGITITNVGIVMILFLASRILGDEPPGRPLLRSGAIVAGGVLGLSLLAYVFSSWQFPAEPRSPRSGGSREFLRPPEITYFTERFPRVLANAVIPDGPSLDVNHRPTAEDRFDRVFTFEPAGKGGRVTPGVRGWLVGGLLALGVWGAWQRRDGLGRAILAAGAVVVYNMALHWTFGAELFLYTQHWQPALALILSGGLAVGRSRRAVALSVAAAIVVLVAYLNAMTLAGMIELLEGQGARAG